MSKQIDGKRYNAAAARKVGYGDDDAGLACLYVKRNGECFLARQSGKIEPLTTDKALSWAIANKLTAQYAAALDYATNDKRKITVYLTDTAAASLRKINALWGTTQSEAIDKLLQDGYQRAAEGQRIKEQLMLELEIKYGFKP